MKKSIVLFLTLSCLTLSSCNSSNIAATKSAGSYLISVNELQFILANSADKVMANPEIGNITVLDFSTFPPQKTNIADVPCSVTGPPTGVAITPDNKLALVSASMKINPTDKTSQLTDNRVTVIDLETKTIINTLTVGNKPSGISITQDGKTALVCNRNDGTITALKITDKKVTVSKTVKVTEPETSLSHVVIAPGDKYALATLNQDNAVIKIQLKKGVPTKVTQKITVGTGPYCLDINPDGQTAIAANVGGNNVTVLDISSDEIKVTDTIQTEMLSEGLDISPDGQWAVVSSMGYSMRKPDDPQRKDHGQLFLLQKVNNTYKGVQIINTDRVGQAAVFTPDSKYVVTSSFESRRLRIYELKQVRLVDTGIIIDVPGQPCALRIAQ